jgi:hypothetical protein
MADEEQPRIEGKRNPIGGGALLSSVLPSDMVDLFSCNSVLFSSVVLFVLL